MSQTYGLCPTNHPIGQSAIRLILSIGHLGERQRHGRRNAELTPVSMALASNRCARLTLIPRSACGWALPSPALLAESRGVVTRPVSNGQAVLMH
jgi:hypothetical protein